MLLASRSLSAGGLPGPLLPRLLTAALLLCAGLGGCGGDLGATTESAADVMRTSCPGAPAWAAGVAYKTGALVTYQGKIYECLQAHTSQSDWTPAAVPALWQDTGTSGCPGGGPVVTISASQTTFSAPGTLTLRVTAMDSVAVDRMEIYENGHSVATSATFTRTFGDASQNGTYDYTAKAYDASHNVGQQSLTVVVRIGGGGPPGATEYAPYFYTWGFGNSAYAFSGLTDLRAKSGLSAVSLAFVIANSTGGTPCSVTNNGSQDYIETTMAADIAGYLAGGGRIKVSFGGASGMTLESDRACATATDLFNVLDAFVQRTGLLDLDFDVEQPEVLSPAVDRKRAQALAQLQGKYPGVQVSFTLTALPRDKWGTPGGLSPEGLDVVKAAIQAGVQIRHVNLMTMDYGPYYSSGKKMGDLAISALTDAQAQLQGLYPGLSATQILGMLGATPMIGVNDVSSEVFSQEDARTLVRFARSKGLGLVSFWAIDRDQPCPFDSLAVCSKVNRANFEFNDIFKVLQ